MKKFLRKFVVCFIVALILCGTFSCLNINAANEKQYVIDNADFLTEDEEAELTEAILEVVDKQKFEIVILTEKSIMGFAQAYADDYFDYNGYGYGNDRDGVLLLVTEDEWHLSTSGLGIDVYTESRLDEFEDDCVSLLRSKDYYEAFNTCIEMTDEFITDETSFKWFSALIISLIVGFVIAFIVTSSMKSKLKSVRRQLAANEYTKNGSMNVSESRDFYLYSTMTRVARPKNNSSRTHTSSSGRSHGGRGGRL